MASLVNMSVSDIEVKSPLSFSAYNQLITSEIQNKSVHPFRLGDLLSEMDLGVPAE